MAMATLTQRSLLSLTAASQIPDDSIRKHYQAAQDLYSTGKVDEAISEYRSALGEAYGRLGRIFIAEGEYRQAAKALERAVTQGAGAETILIDQATAYFYLQRYEQAIDPLKKALAANSQSPVPHHLLGKVHFMLRQYDQAVGELDLALKSAPADVDIAYTLALAWLKQEQVEPARKIFTQMLRNLGNRPEVHTLFGRAYRETNHPDEAIAEFEKVIALDPKYPRANYNLGLTYLLKDGTLKLKEAGAAFRAELALYPDEFLAIYNLGLVCVVEAKYGEGVRLLEKAARMRPQNPGVFLFLGNSYHGSGQFEKAIESLRKSLELASQMDRTNPQAADAHFLLGQSLLKSGRAEEGEKELEIARELKAKSLTTDRERIVAYLKTEEYKGSQGGTGGEEKALSTIDRDAKTGGKFKDSELQYGGIVANIHNQLGLLSAERQNFQAAAEQFRLAIEWMPGLSGVHYNLGLAYFKAELYREAVSPLESEVKTDPANITVKHLLGMCYFMTDDFTRASALLKEVQAARPNNTGLYYTLSLSLIKEGKISEASEMIQKMLVSGDSAQIHLLLGQAYHAQNDDPSALEELKKASQMDSRLPMAHYYSGMIYIKMSKFEEAARELEAELAINPKDVQAKYHLGFVRLSSGQVEGGMKLMREVLDLKPDFADARFELGKALLQQGDVKSAIESLEAAMKLGPDKPHIHYQLGRAYLAAGREADAQKCFATFKELKDKERNRSGSSTTN